MLELFSAETTIVLGLDLSDEEDKLLRTAMSLAKKTGARLVLVHAAPPLRIYNLADADMVLPYEAFEHESCQTDIETREMKLQALRDRLPPELVIDLRVVRDLPKNALDQVAEDVKASLIICGIRPVKSTTWYESMAPPLSLMASSPFPVMIVALDTVIDFSSRDHRVLVADNLKGEGLYALKAALGLCKSISYRQLIHLHVENTSYRDINATVEKIRVAMIEGKIPANPDFEADQYLAFLKNELKSVMSDRLEEADRDFAHGLHWTPRIRFGQPLNELQNQLRESRSDILVFVKQHFLPYWAMLEPNVASITVPDLALAH